MTGRPAGLRAGPRISGPTRRLEWIAAITALSLLVLGVVLVMRPFFTSLLWATVLTFSTWPLYLRLRRRLGGPRSLSALVMTVVLAAAFVLPLALLSRTIASNAAHAIDLVRGVLDHGPPDPPEWITRLPLAGPPLAQAWSEIAHDSARFAALIRPYLVFLRGWAISSGLAVGAELVELSIAVFVSFFLYRDGAEIAAQIGILGQRLAGDQGQRILQVASSTVRGVVYGIIGTSLIQGVLLTVGFLIVHAPGAIFLGLIAFFMAFLPSGPMFIWVPLAVWLLSKGFLGQALFLAVWGLVVVGSVDHFLKPLLISRESNLPLLLIFFGVLGGALAFGVIGVFLGPVLLAVAFALLRDWLALVRAQPPVTAAQAAPPTPAKQPVASSGV